MMLKNICHIRKYKEKDQENLRNICKLTSKSYHKVMDCVPIIYTDYYMEDEPCYFCLSR